MDRYVIISTYIIYIYYLHYLSVTSHSTLIQVGPEVAVTFGHVASTRASTRVTAAANRSIVFVTSY